MYFEGNVLNYEKKKSERKYYTHVDNNQYDYFKRYNIRK